MLRWITCSVCFEGRCEFLAHATERDEAAGPAAATADWRMGCQGAAGSQQLRMNLVF